MKVLKNAKFTGNIKINDTNTDIYFQAYDDGVLQKLNAGQCSFRIKNDTGYLITISNVSTETDYITFKSNELKPLPVGTYYLELWVEDSTGTYIYPDESFCKLRINENVTVAQGTTIPTISLEEYENKLQGYVDIAVADGIQKIESDFDKYVDSITNSTIATATKASQDAATAINTANSANAAAQNATNIANAAKSTADSLNQSISNAQSTASAANSSANSALSIANDLKSTIDGAYYGGRNLLLQTENDWATNSTYFRTASPVKQSSKHLGSDIYDIQTQWSGVEFKIDDLVNREIINLQDTYIYSVYIKKTSDTLDLGSVMYFYSGNGLVTNPNISNIAESATSQLKSVQNGVWQQIRVSIKFTSTTPVGSVKNFFGLEFRKVPGESVYFACPKLERGINGTDYTPAPDDLQAEIDAIKSQIQALQSQ